MDTKVKMKRLDIVKALDGAGLYDVLTGMQYIGDAFANRARAA